MKTKLGIILILGALFMSCKQGLAQTLQTKLCKTWVAYQYEEANGNKFPPLDEMKNDYLRLNRNGTYESLESGKLLIKGTWTLDSITMTLTVKQNQVTEYPAEVKSKITKLTDHELILEGTDAGGAKLIIYSRPKKL